MAAKGAVLLVSSLMTLSVVSACGATGSGAATSDDQSGSATGATHAEAQAAQAKVQPYLSADPSLKLTPLTSKPPKGKTVTFVSCPLPTCQQFLDGARAAASELGWKVDSVDEGLTPDTIKSTWESAAENPGDAVIGNTTLPAASIASSLATLKSKHVPVVSIGGPSAPSEPVIAQFINKGDSTVQSKIWADWIVADSNANAKIAFFWDPSFPSLKPYRDGLVGEVHEMCQACDVSVETTNFSSGIGKTIPSQIVSYAQRNPEVQYVVVPIGDAAVGVAQALAAAGLSDKVKLVTGNADTINMQAISNGNQAMGVAGQSYSIGWRAVDILVRHMMGMEIPETQPQRVWFLMTKANLPKDISDPWDVPNYQGQFLSAWHLGG